MMNPEQIKAELDRLERAVPVIGLPAIMGSPIMRGMMSNASRTIGELAARILIEGKPQDVAVGEPKTRV